MTRYHDVLGTATCREPAEVTGQYFRFVMREQDRKWKDETTPRTERPVRFIRPAKHPIFAALPSVQRVFGNSTMIR